MKLANLYENLFPWVVAVITVLFTVAFIRVSKWISIVLGKKFKDIWARRRLEKSATVLILRDVAECDRTLQAYKEYYPFPLNFLGLDCEWVNQKGKNSHPVALLQIATPLNDCFLIRLCKMKGPLPLSLKELLEDKNILKFGVGIQDDAKKLSSTFGLNVSGCVDLRHVTLRCLSRQESTQEEENPKGQYRMGLDALCRRYLGAQMDKSWRVRCSDWEAEHLSDRQIEYAANDAIVAVHIFLTLAEVKANERKNSLLSVVDFGEKLNTNSDIKTTSSNPQTPRTFSFNCKKTTVSLNKYEVEANKGYVANPLALLSNSAFCQKAESLCKGIVDLGFKTKFIHKPPIKTERFLTRQTKKPYKIGTTQRKSPLYTNCQLEAPDGAVLCALDRKKAEWYIDKDIGEMVSEDPYTVRLKFEPSGRPEKDDNYYLTFKDNICVVCGKGESYLRKNVVPHEYRKYFPDCLKDHHSHDVVLMCPQCHRLSAMFDENLRQRLARQYGAPLGNKEIAKFTQDPIRMKIKSAAKALRYAADKLPQKRELELQEILKEHYKTAELTPELITETSTIDVQRENVNYKSHGEVVIKQVTEQKKLLEFEKMWRLNFIETMSPEHLPELWSVHHRYEKMKEALEKIDLQ